VPPSSGSKRQKLLSYRVLIIIENQHVAALSVRLFAGGTVWSSELTYVHNFDPCVSWKRCIASSRTPLTVGVQFAAAVGVLDRWAWGKPRRPLSFVELEPSSSWLCCHSGCRRIRNISVPWTEEARVKFVAAS